MNPISDDSCTHADAALFADILSCQTHLPAEFVAAATPPCPVQTESLLHSVALIEDMPGEDAPDTDERSGLSPLIQRMEAKLDVLLLLTGRLLLRDHGSPPLCNLRWSARGVRMEHPDTARFAVGSSGVLRLQPASWLPEPLELPAHVIARDGSQVWFRFDELPASLGDALERHLFRQHRREIAQARRR